MRKLNDLQLHFIINANGGEPVGYDNYGDSCTVSVKDAYHMATDDGGVDFLWGYGYGMLEQMGLYGKGEQSKMTYAEYKRQASGYRYYYNNSPEREAKINEAKRRRQERIDFLAYNIERYGE